MPLNQSATLVGAFVFALSLPAQQPALQPGPKPANLAPQNMPPARLLAFATSHNGFGEELGKPWHVKATFDVLTGPRTGKFTSGTFEETWYAPANYQRSYSYPGTTQTDTSTPDGLYRAGDQEWPSFALLSVRRLLVSPIVSEDAAPDGSLQVRDVNFGKAAVPCLYEVPAAQPGMLKEEEEKLVERSPRLCFEPTAPILRFAAAMGGTRTEVTFSRTTVVNGHFIAQDIQVLAGREPVLRIHVLEAGAAPPASAVFTPTAGAQKMSGPVTVPWDAEVQDRLPAPTNTPVYPLGAINGGIGEPVDIALVISPEGKVTSTNILEGPPMLRPYALESVRQSRFKPFLVAGKPVEVHTTAHVEFNLHAALNPDEKH